MIRHLMAYRETRHLNLDNPSTTLLRRDILKKNDLLRKVYQEWYSIIMKEVPKSSEPILELGTGPGFLNEMENSLVTSEIQWIPGVDLVLNGQSIPFQNGSLRAIVMTNVLHHIPNVKSFFSEAIRCLMDGGKVIMIEPWLTGWSRLIYQNFHHEPINPEALTWEFPFDGPLSSANEALPWMIFYRDREEFENSFPQYEITRIDSIMPFLYLMTGGYSSRIHLPGWTFSLWKLIEAKIKRWHFDLGMFAVIVLQKRL
jgi:SAM-dependent methyltransferase